MIPYDISDLPKWLEVATEDAIVSYDALCEALGEPAGVFVGTSYISEPPSGYVEWGHHIEGIFSRPALHSNGKIWKDLKWHDDIDVFECIHEIKSTWPDGII